MITVNAYQANRFPGFRQTFGGTGKYRDIQFVTDDLDADWQLVGSPIPDLGPLRGKKIIYVQNETPDWYLPSLDQVEQCSAIITPLRFDNIKDIPQFERPACLLWMYGVKINIGEGAGHTLHPTSFLSLEDLIGARVPTKTRLCSIVVSSKTLLYGHRLRIEFVHALAKHFGDRIDIFGFGIRPLLDKREAIDPYLFSIAIENSTYDNYVTEKLSDVYLGYTMPIYHGAPNATEFFPADSMLKIDINHVEESIAHIDALISHPERFNLAAVKEARRRVLMDYNCFDLIAQAVEQMELQGKGRKNDENAA